MKPEELNTKTPATWCPGCFNFQILAGAKNALAKEISGGKRNEFAIVTGIGCASKIFDYINLPGINGLHGRVLPTCLGLKVGNPNLKVVGFAGDGDAYAEGIEHLIHIARYNPDVKYVVHNNQIFALTVGQPTPTTETGFKDKTTPLGVKSLQLNPIKLMLACGASFVARVFAEAKQIEWILGEAFKHRGFAFIEVIQPCIIFHPDIGLREKTYNLQESGHDKTNLQDALKKSEEFDYSSIIKNQKIPLGIFYQKERECFEDQWPQLVDLKKQKKCWKDVKR